MSKRTKIPGLRSSTSVRIAGPLLVQARLADVRRYEPAFRENAEPGAEEVHDMRVAARRLRAALTLFGDGDLRALEPQVKALQDALGRVREIQVQRRWIVEHAGEGQAGEALAKRIDAGRRAAEEDLHDTLRGWTSAVALQIEKLAPAAASPGRLGGKRIARQLRRAVEKVERCLGAVDSRVGPREAHRLRIATKKLRYLAELAAPGERGARRLLDELEPFLELVGTLHDQDVRLAQLEKLAGAAVPAAQRSTAHALLSSERQARSRQAASLRDVLERWRDADVLGAARRAFGRRTREAQDAIPRTHPRPAGPGPRIAGRSTPTTSGDAAPTP